MKRYLRTDGALAAHVGDDRMRFSFGLGADSRSAVDADSPSDAGSPSDASSPSDDDPG